MKLACLLLCLCCYPLAHARRQQSCEVGNVVAFYKKPIYEFSMRFLDRVSQDTEGDFVASPIAAWMQLVHLTEGSQGRTLKQLWKVTGYRAPPCMQTVIVNTLDDMIEQLGNQYRCLSLVIVDKYLAVNHKFKNKLEKSDKVLVLSLNFDEPHESFLKANRIIKTATGVSRVLDPYDFDLMSLILIDVLKFSSSWQRPFDPVFTTTQKFYAASGQTYQIPMMRQTGFFNYTRLQAINAEVLEMPCVDERHSMLVFLPTNGSIKDIFFYMKRIRLATIFNTLKKSGPYMMDVRMPKFNMNSELINLAELVHDMGVSDVFNPDLANLSGISKFQMAVNNMKQVVDIEFSEKGVSVDVSQFYMRHRRRVTKFEVNKPFAYMFVDKVLDLILFAGLFSTPAAYQEL